VLTRFDRPFSATSLFAAIAVAALLSPALVQPARAQAAQQATLPEGAQSDAAKPDAAKPDAAKQPAAQNTGAGDVAAVDPGSPAPQKSLTTRAIEKVRQVAKSANDIFSRVPCLPPKGGVPPVGSLPHVAGKLAAGQPVTIVAFGSSSTQGWGSSSPEFNYPNRLATQLRRQYPGVEITVLNRGVGGEDAPQMMKRLQTAVLDNKPDLVIWQVGTNAVLHNLDPADTAKLVSEGIAQIQAADADIVLVDPQYSPRMIEHAESAGQMVKFLSRVAHLRHVGIFPRFEVMREWHDQQDLPVDTFTIADGLHMNDWGYACFAQLLGDDIIKSVGQIKLGVNVPAQVRTYRPM
jgi:lysophospholipase L1-like esterase